MASRAWNQKDTLRLVLKSGQLDVMDDSSVWCGTKRIKTVTARQLTNLAQTGQLAVRTPTANDEALARFMPIRLGMLSRGTPAVFVQITALGRAALGAEGRGVKVKRLHAVRAPTWGRHGSMRLNRARAALLWEERSGPPITLGGNHDLTADL